MGDDTSAGVDRGLHLGDLGIDVLHELDDEIDELVLVHRLGVEVGDQEGDIVSLDGLTTQDDERLGTLGQEAHKLLGQQLLQLICLLHSNRDAQRVNRSLYQHTLLLGTSDDDWVQQELGRGAEKKKSPSVIGEIQERKGHFLCFGSRDFLYLKRSKFALLHTQTHCHRIWACRLSNRRLNVGNGCKKGRTGPQSRACCGVRHPESRNFEGTWRR